MRYDINDHDRDRIEAQRELHEALGVLVAGLVVALLVILLLWGIKA